MNKKTIFYPLLFALFPIFSLISANIGEVVAASTWDILLPVLVALAGVIAFWLFARSLTRSNERAALITALAVIFFFSYGYVRETLLGVSVGGVGLARHRYLLPVVGAIFVSGSIFFWRTKGNLALLTPILNATSVFLIAISFFGSAQYLIGPKSDAHTPGVEGEEIAPQATSASDNMPDIYYIILDDYAAPSTHRSIYNNPAINDFVAELEKKGFFVPKEARTNYSLTHLSLPSSLNMMYLNDFLAGREQSDDFGLTYNLIQNNNVQKFLRERGYKFVNVGSWWVGTRSNRNADLSVNLSSSEFLLTLIQTTIFDPVSVKFGIFNGRLEIWKTTPLQFDAVAGAGDVFHEPTFVFSHFLVPHKPYVFNEDGSFVSEEEQASRDVKENVVRQTAYVNKKVLEMVDKIFSKSETPPIIILQADHGTNHKKIWDDYGNADVLKEKMRPFIAYHLPGGGKEVFYDAITPVNSFRLIFNRYFGADFEILPDRSYFSSYLTPYKFADVTDIVSY